MYKKRPRADILPVGSRENLVDGDLKTSKKVSLLQDHSCQCYIQYLENIGQVMEKIECLNFVPGPQNKLSHVLILHTEADPIHHPQQCNFMSDEPESCSSHDVADAYVDALIVPLIRWYVYSSPQQCWQVFTESDGLEFSRNQATRGLE